MRQAAKALSWERQSVTDQARRVLVLSTSYPQNEWDPSGHFVRSHALSLSDRGHQVVVLVPGPFAKSASPEDGLSVHRLGGSHLFGWPGAWTRARENPLALMDGLRFARRLADRAASIDSIDCVVAHWMVPTALPLLTLVETRAPSLRSALLEVVSHGADVRLLRALPRAIRARVTDRLCDRATRFTFVANSLRETFLRSLPESLAQRVFDKSRVAPCPIAVPARAEVADPRAHDFVNQRYAIWVGRDLPSKRLDLAIDAARAAEVNLLVLGPELPRRGSFGGDRDKRIVFMGQRSRGEALAWIAHASVLLSTSREEGAPTAAREARALGVPVVACDAGDLREWSKTDSGISMVSPDAGSIARALVAM